MDMPPGKCTKDSHSAVQSDDPAQGYPPWSKTLLLLLDFAIIEGAQRQLDTFVGLLELAQKELETQAHLASYGADANDRH